MLRGRKSAGVTGALDETAGGNRTKASSHGFRLPFIPALGAEMALLAAMWRGKSMAMGRWQAALALVLLATFVAGSGGSSGGSITSTMIQNSCAKFTRGSLKAQSFSRTLIEAQRDFI
jgi:hypothetical protein